MEIRDDRVIRFGAGSSLVATYRLSNVLPAAGRPASRRVASRAKWIASASSPAGPRRRRSLIGTRASGSWCSWRLSLGRVSLVVMVVVWAPAR